MNKVFAPTLALIVACLAFSQAFAACESYEEPQYLSETEFMEETSFGTLALKRYSDRYIAFPKTGCYDLSAKKYHADTKFFINSSNHESEITYMAAVVTRLLGPLAGVPERSLELYRNRSDNKSAGSWVKTTDDEFAYIEGQAIPGEVFGPVKSGYKTERPINVNDYGGFGAVDLSISPELVTDWHALIVDIYGRPSPSKVYQVLKNTRSSINSAASYLSDFLKYDGTVLAKIFLVKFQASSEKLLDEPVLDLSRSKCLYLDYRLGGTTKAPIEVDFKLKYLVLRFDSKAEC